MTKKKKELDFDQAYSELESISSEIQSGAISIDDLSIKVARASELISYCKTKLRTIEGDINQVFDGLNEEKDA